MPQAPPQQPQVPPAQDPSQAGYYQYQQPLESQLNQPYQDLLAAGAMGQLPGVFNRMNQQGQLGQIYGQGAAANLGGAAAGMGQLSPLTGQSAGLAGGTLGQYGQLMAPNLGIQQGLASEIAGIQGGNLDVDPTMVQQWGQQEQLLHEQLRRSLGPDYATSTPGIEALARFQQGKQTALASANYNRLLGLVNAQQGGLGALASQGAGFGNLGAGIQGQQFGQGSQLGTMYGQNAMDLYNQQTGLRNNQLGGAGQLLGLIGAQQNLYANIPNTMAQYANQMGNYGQAAMGATGPYQQDRFGQFQASQFPTKGGYTGTTLTQQGDRLINSASAMGGGGGGTPQNVSAPSSFQDGYM